MRTLRTSGWGGPRRGSAQRAPRPRDGARSSARRDDEAASGVVTIMLTILVIMLIIAMVTSVWMPVWMKEREQSHMRVVNTQFNELKSNIDMLVLQNDPTYLVASPIALGTEGFALFETDTSGAFSINYFKGSAPEFSCNVRNQTGAVNVTSSGSIKFDSNNRYYSDQRLSFENGAIIVTQGTKSVMRVGPQFQVEKLGTVTKVGFVLISLTGPETAQQGVGSVTIDARLVTYTSSSETFKNPTWLNISISTDHPSAWARWYNNTLLEAGLGTPADFKTTVTASTVTVAINNTKFFDLGYALVKTDIETNAGRKGATAPMPGAVAIWHLNENSGGMAMDATSNGNDGTLTGASWTTHGAASSALSFDGSDRVEVPDSVSLNPTTGLTVEAWLKWDIDPATGDGWANVLDKDKDNGYQLQFSGTAKAGPVNNAFEFAVKTDVERRFVWSNTSVQSDKWYHVVGTYSAAEKSIRIYINGVLESTMLINGTTVNPTVLPLTIGCRHKSLGVYDRYFHGSIDEVYVYGRALSQTEVSMRYVNTRPAQGG
jgi:hypothetical protein